MNAPDLLPPHSIEAEQSLIGGLLLDSSAYDRIADLISDADFYRDDHRRIYRHIAMLCNAGKAVDVVVLAESLEDSNEAEICGGWPTWGKSPRIRRRRPTSAAMPRSSVSGQHFASCRALRACSNCPSALRRWWR